MTDILTIYLPVPVPVIKTIPRWRVFLALFDPRAHFTTCSELQHQLCRETEATATLQTETLRQTMKFIRVGPVYDGNTGRAIREDSR